MTKKTPTTIADDPSMALDEADTAGDTGAVDELDDAETGEQKTVEPKPGDADYDWSGHYGTDDLYVHTYPDGKVVALRRFKDIYSKQWLRSIRHLPTEFDIESAAIDRAACPTAQEIIDNRPCPVDGPDDDFAELYKAWVESDTEGLKTGE